MLLVLFLLLLPLCTWSVVYAIAAPPPPSTTSSTHKSTKCWGNSYRTHCQRQRVSSAFQLSEREGSTHIFNGQVAQFRVPSSPATVRHILHNCLFLTFIEFLQPLLGFVLTSVSPYILNICMCCICSFLLAYQ